VGFVVDELALGPHGRRQLGKPKLRWLDCIENNLKSITVKKLKKKAEDGSVWVIILKEALVKLIRAVCRRRRRKEGGGGGGEVALGRGFLIWVLPVSGIASFLYTLYNLRN
jgi:hypothetical protein